jgi:hypothetical protein
VLPAPSRLTLVAHHMPRVLAQVSRVGTANVVLIGRALRRLGWRRPSGQLGCLLTSPTRAPDQTTPEQRCSGGMLGYVLIVVESPEA